MCAKIWRGGEKGEAPDCGEAGRKCEGDAGIEAGGGAAGGGIGIGTDFGGGFVMGIDIGCGCRWWSQRKRRSGR